MCGKSREAGREKESMVRIGFVQNSPAFGMKRENFRQVEELLAGLRADLLVLPELFATGYTFASRQEVEDLAEQGEGETAEFLVRLAEKINGIVVGGFVEDGEGRYYNSALMVSREGVIDVYRKIHLFNREKVWFSPGDRSLAVHTLGGMKVGMMICFDWIFPETARTLALMGAEVLAHPANLVLPYCQNAMTTRCIENRLYAVTANRIGSETRGEDSFSFTGASQITSPRGEALSSAASDRVCCNAEEIDLETARNKRLNAFNDLLGDRRPEFYFRD